MDQRLILPKKPKYFRTLSRGKDEKSQITTKSKILQTGKTMEKTKIRIKRRYSPSSKSEINPEDTEKVFFKTIIFLKVSIGAKIPIPRETNDPQISPWIYQEENMRSL